MKPNFFNNIKSKKEKIIISILCFFLIILIIRLINERYANYNVEKFNTDILIYDENLNQSKEIKNTFIPTLKNLHEIKTMEDIEKYLFNIDPTAYATIEDFPIEELANMDLSLDLYGSDPKVLIMHTHSQEWFIDSDISNPSHSIVGVGQRLAEILVYDYGVSVVHDTGIYDLKDGELQRGTSYETMEPAVTQILEKYPTIEVIIDLHRDGLPDDIHLVTEIDGRPTAKIMFFNGITRYNDNGTPVEMPDLYNPYIKENLALSLQLYLTANENYPGFARRNYIKPYRYSLHFKPRSMLVEVGSNTNTVEEAKNAMYPLADIIMQVLQ